MSSSFHSDSALLERPLISAQPVGLSPKPPATNVTEGQPLADGLRTAFGVLYDRLSQHCGPLARYAMIPENDGTGHYNHIFTKDGITIAKMMHFLNDPVAEYARRACTYIAGRVNARCHDGTTTAMMLLAGIAAKKVATERLTPTQIDAIYERVLVDLEETIARNTLTVEQLAAITGWSQDEAKRFVIKHQALIASKGDLQLAEAMVETIMALPTDLYSEFSFKQSERETDERYSVLVQEGDFVCGGHIVNKHELNRMMGTEYLGEDVDLLITDNELIRGNPEMATVYNWLLELIRKAEAENQGTIVDPLARDLVIVCPNYDDKLMALAQSYNMRTTAGSGRIILMVFTIDTAGFKNYVVPSVRAMANAKPFGECLTTWQSDAIIRHARVRQVGHRLEFSNLYARDGGVVHPFYATPGTSAQYDELVGDMKEHIKELLSGRGREHHNPKHAAYCIHAFRQLVTQNIVTLQIGGTAHDFSANLLVAEDAFGAVIASLENGFVFGGLSRLLGTLVATLPEDNECGVRQAFYDTLVSLTNIIFLDADLGRTDFAIAPGASPIAHHLLVGGTPVKIDGDLQLDAEAVLLQPADGLKEMMKRLRELLPKMAATGCLIDLERKG